MKYKDSFIFMFLSISLFLLSIFCIPILFQFLFPIIIGFLIALCINPIVQKIEKYSPFKRKYAVIFTIIFLLGIFFFLFYLLFNFVFSEIQTFILNIDDILNNAQLIISNIISFINETFPFINLKEINFNNIDYMQYIQSLSEPLIKASKNIPDLFIKFLFICLFGFFFTLKLTKMKNIFFNKYEHFIDKIYLEFKKIMKGYFIAQVKLFFIMFIILWIPFFIFKIPYHFTLAIITAFLDALPIFGTGTILIPLIIFELYSGNYSLVILLLILYLITQIVRRLIEPKIMGEAIGLSTFGSIFCLFIGYQLLGAWGLILGIPIGVILKNLYQNNFFDIFIYHLFFIKEDISLWFKYKK